MGEPCKQEGIIGGLEATQEAILGTLKELKHGQERMIPVLETIASQGTRITKLETDTETLYARVRKVELNAVEHGVKITAGAGFVSIIVSAIAAFIVKHMGK